MDYRAIPPSELRDLLDYDPETGDLRWRDRPLSMFVGHYRKRSHGRWNSTYAGKLALTAKTRGYGCGSIHGHAVKAHRVAWAWFYGEWPADEIDHINGNRSDNRIANLRSVTTSENAKNRRRRRDNTSGENGVHWERGYWKAQVSVSGREINLGRFLTIVEAKAARSAANILLSYHENHGLPGPP